MKKKAFSDKNYPPKCEYCLYGRIAPDGTTVLCEKKGIVDKDDRCRGYKYDALKRTPMKAPEISTADPADFEL